MKYHSIQGLHSTQLGRLLPAVIESGSQERFHFDELREHPAR